MFNKFFGHNKKWYEDCKKLIDGTIAIQDFIKQNATVTLYYSTPFGEDANGRQQIWVLSNRKNEIQHFPAFSSKKKCADFLLAMGRKDFMIIKGDLISLLDSLNAHPLLQKFGVVIDPNSDLSVAIDPQIRAIH